MLEHKHLLLLADINKLPKSSKYLENWLENLIILLEMKALIKPKAVYCHTVGNRGLTAICAIETSHIAFHVWDEEIPYRLQLDVYTCSKLNLAVVRKQIEEFKPENIKYKLYDRENDFK